MISNNREIEFYMRGKQDAKKELQELITELNSKVMLKDRQIKEALRIIEEKCGEYDIPEELEEILKDDE